jgi:glutaredoxin-like protein
LKGGNDLSQLLSEKDAEDIKKFFNENLINPVTLRLFVQDPNQPGECMYCKETEQIAKELSNLSDKIRLEIHQFPTDAEKIKTYDIQRVPALILEKEEGQDSGVRFYGIPSGYEFGTLIEDISDLSTGKTKLAANLMNEVENVQKDVTIKVFVTPT